MSSLNSPETEYSVTGSITGGAQSVTIDVGAYTAVGIQITGTWSGTLGFDATVDGTTFNDANAVPATGRTSVTTTTTNGIWSAVVNGVDKFRIFSDAFASGTANITLLVNDGAGPPSNAVRLLDSETVPTLVTVSGIIRQTATGSLIGPSQSVTLDVGGYGSVGIQVTGTWTGTLGFDASINGTNFEDMQVVPTGGTSAVTTTTINGIWYALAGGLNKVRVFSDALGSGTAVINLQASAASGKNFSVAGGSGGTSSTDDAAFALGVDALTPVGGQFSSTVDTVNDGDTGAFHMTQRRAMHTTLRRESDGLEFGTSAIPFRVDPTGATTQPSSIVAISQPNSSGTITADEGVVEISSGTFTAVGVQLTGTWVATIEFEGTLNGSTWVAIGAQSAGAGNGEISSTTSNGVYFIVAVGLNKVRVRASSFTSGSVIVDFRGGIGGSFASWHRLCDISTGQGAHDAAISGNPVRAGARGRTSDVTAVANDDTADLVTDTVGKLITLPYAIPENFLSGVTAGITGTSNTSVIAAQGAGVRIYVTQLLVTNAHNTVNTVVEIKDNTTVIYRGFAAKGGGGFSLTFPVPLRLAANVALQAANITTGSETYVSASGYKAV